MGYSKNTRLENIFIEKLVFGGIGLATAPDGRKIMISGGALPEATVHLRVLKNKKQYIQAQILETVVPSPLEQALPKKWQVYGGCRWLPLPYTKQLEIKEAQVHEAFHAFGGHIAPDAFHPIIGSPESEHYRNKLEFSWGKYISAKEGIHDEYRFGFHKAGAFDRIENCHYCILADDEINAIFGEVDRWARASELPTYDPKTCEGFWRHFVVRKSKKTSEILLIFSLNTLWDETSDFAQECRCFLENLTAHFPHITSVFIFENTGKADIVTGEARCIFGASTIQEGLLDMTFFIRPKSFFQVNSRTAELLYKTIRTLLQQHSNSTLSQTILLDLYAGTGTIGLLLSPYVQYVYSVEQNASACLDGQENAQRNMRTNIECIEAKVEDFLQDFSLKKSEEKNPCIIVVDPPREGLHPKALPVLRDFGAKEIIYVSCNPGTLIRDLEFFCAPQEDQKFYYSVCDIIPLDMFPHTHHIETIVRLKKC